MSSPADMPMVEVPSGSTVKDFAEILDQRQPISHHWALLGALVAAVFAAAMSSLDSALNSLAAALTVDFLSRFKPDLAEASRLTFAKTVVVIAGIVGIAIGIYSSRTEAPQIDLILAFMGYFAGGLLGLFLLGMLTRRANGTGAFVGAIVGTLVVLMMTENDFGLPHLYEWVGMEPIPFIWSTALGLTATLVREDGREGEVFSLIGPKRYDAPWKDIEAQGWIAPADCVEVRVTLPDGERLAYATSDPDTRYTRNTRTPIVSLHTRRKGDAGVSRVG